MSSLCRSGIFNFRNCRLNNSFRQAPEPNKKMTNKILNEKNIANLKEQKKNKSVSHDCNRTIFLVHAMIHSSNSHSVFWRVFFFSFPHYVCFISIYFFLRFGIAPIGTCSSEMGTLRIWVVLWSDDGTLWVEINTK